MQKLQKSLESLKINNNQNDKLIIIYNDKNLLHLSSKKHPQCPQRIISIINHLKQLKSLKLSIQKIDTIESQQIKGIIKQVHGENYHQFVQQMWYQGINKSQLYINIDTYFMKDTYKAALAACQTTIYGVNQLLNDKYFYSLALVRPPGHHSGMKNQPHGFSFFNNVAIGVNYALPKTKNNKIAIVDWDVHHGQGTQKIFYKNKDVLFISIHRFDKAKFFPHIKQSGSQNTGQGLGQGYNINICWNLPQKAKGQLYQRQETCGNQEYIQCFNRIVMPILIKFNPDMIFVSCGFDSAQGDQIGNLKLNQVGYTYMTQSLMSLNKKIMLVLEGGYNLESLAWASQSVIRSLIRQQTEQTKKVLKKLKEKMNINKIGQQGINECINYIKKYWQIPQKIK